MMYYKKEIWSNRYGKDKTEGLQCWLLRNVKGYKRSMLQNYLTGFSVYIGKPNKSDSPNLASDNFSKWIEYVLSKNKLK